MELNPIRYSFNTQLIKSNNTQQTSTTRETTSQKELQNNTMSEVLGKSQVNFTANNKENEFQLSIEDNRFLNKIANNFKANEKQRVQMKEVTKNYLQEKGVETLQDFNSEDICEYTNNVAPYDERLAKILGLPFDNMELAMEIDKHIEKGEIVKPQQVEQKSEKPTKKYEHDTPALRHVMGDYLNPIDSFNVYKYLAQISDDLGYKSIFDLFNKENILLGQEKFNQAIKNINISDDTKEDLFIDLYKEAKKTQEERELDNDDNKIQYNMVMGISSAYISEKISDIFGINLTSKEIELLCNRKNNMKKDGPSFEEIAFRIADNHNLPSGAEKELVEIIKDNIDPLTLREMSKDYIKTIINDMLHPNDNLDFGDDDL